jgi:indolepyruvate ferredoxin oxidoreductase
MERALIGEYEALQDEVLEQLAPHNHSLAVELAQIPEHIRGYGYVKHRHIDAARVRQDELLAAFRASRPPSPKLEVLAAA